MKKNNIKTKIIGTVLATVCALSAGATISAVSAFGGEHQQHFRCGAAGPGLQLHHAGQQLYILAQGQHQRFHQGQPEFQQRHLPVHHQRLAAGRRERGFENPAQRRQMEQRSHPLHRGQQLERHRSANGRTVRHQHQIRRLMTPFSTAA